MNTTWVSCRDNIVIEVCETVKRKHDFNEQHCWFSRKTFELWFKEVPIVMAIPQKNHCLFHGKHPLKVDDNCGYPHRKLWFKFMYNLKIHQLSEYPWRIHGAAIYISIYLVTWIPSIYRLYVSMYTSTMDPSWDIWIHMDPKILWGFETEEVLSRISDSAPRRHGDMVGFGKLWKTCGHCGHLPLKSCHDCIGNNDPNWLNIFQRGRSTTNQP